MNKGYSWRLVHKWLAEQGVHRWKNYTSIASAMSSYK